VTLRRAGLSTALVLACAAGTGWTTRPQADTLVPGPEGCYDVLVGLWLAVTDRPVTEPRLPPDRARDSTAFVLPPRLQLSTRPLGIPDVEGWMSASAPQGALPTGHRYQAWRPVPDDGLLLWFATPRSGLQAHLAADGTGFKGQARTFDLAQGAQRYERDVTLRRVDCASTPPVAADELSPLPRDVQLDGGSSLALGGTPPPGMRSSARPSGAVGIVARSVGLFAGSDSVAYRIGANDGRIGAVQLIFPSPATADPLIERITARFGPPDPNTAVPGAWWHNRVTEVSVITDAEGGFRVLLQDPRSW